MKKISEQSRRVEDRRGERGLSLVELMITMFVMSVVLLGLLGLFDLNSKIGKVQMQVADMQQSVRIAQHEMIRIVRMAGRGGLPAQLRPVPEPPAAPIFPGKLLPAGSAIEVRNNVPASGDDSFIAVADTASPKVLEGTDVLTVRGVFESPIYQTNPAGAGFFVVDNNGDGALDAGQVTVDNISPSGVPQDLSALADAVTETNAGRPEALLLVSPLEDAIYAVVELAAGGVVTRVGGVVTQVVMPFNINGGSARTPSYRALSPGGGYPNAMLTVAAVGLLEEHRFYVREVHADPGDPLSDLTPALSRARFYPGTEVAYKQDASNFRIDISDNILDLQVALGVDTDNDEIVEEGIDAATLAADDWLFNHPNDNPADVAKWNGTLAAPQRLFYLRISTLARTDRRDRDFEAPLLTTVEDKDYSVSPFNGFNVREERMFRRRLLTTIVDMRNLS